MSLRKPSPTTLLVQEPIQKWVFSVTFSPVFVSANPNVPIQTIESADTIATAAPGVEISLMILSRSECRSSMVWGIDDCAIVSVTTCGQTVKQNQRMGRSIAVEGFLLIDECDLISRILSATG
jgi:hypothetical protein